MARMQLILVFAFAALLGAALAQPYENREQPIALEDVANAGGQHAEEGARPARWLWGGWGGGWNGDWGGGWRVSYRPWGYGYRSYWW
ncbi:uncharacterized protein LOC117890803 [Drosophila subobscura]|uniref:uncharacterized protein LOC117890803 n=1 Tax=Drosophila subobscura TaxID=7241 RepID=UPI00155AB1E8|nr:uncharacterized protein LOC117890803 [Drosophila subobscura]